MDYSTDEDVSPETPIKDSPAKSISCITDSDLTVGDLDIKTLTDEELQERLQQVGLPVTPIVGSTRRLFEKKLAQALLEHPSLELQPSDDETEEEPEAEAVVPELAVNGDIAEESDTSSDDEVTTPAAPVAVTPRRSPRVKTVQEPEIRQRSVQKEESSSSTTVTSTSSSSSYLRSTGVSPLSVESKSPYARPALRSIPSTGNYQTYSQTRFASSAADAVDSSADAASTAPPGLITRYLPALVKIIILLLLLASSYILYISYGSESPYAAVEEAARLAVKTLQAAGDGDEDKAD